jgi:hypothetical protein
MVAKGHVGDSDVWASEAGLEVTVNMNGGAIRTHIESGITDDLL